MAKHTQTIRPQLADDLFECVSLFYGIGAERVKEQLSEEIQTKQIKSKKWCGWKLKAKSNTCKF